MCRLIWVFAGCTCSLVRNAVLCPGWNGIRVSSQSILWVAKEPEHLHSNSEDSDQPTRMCRWIWIFAGYTCSLERNAVPRLKWYSRLLLSTVRDLHALYLYIGQTCYDGLDSRTYTGTISYTKNGRTCQKWSSQSPQTHEYNTNSQFPLDESVDAAENYCRDPDGYGTPWCYTINSAVRWEECRIPICK